MNFLTTEKFKDHFKFEGETIILSPNVAMIASLMNYKFNTNFEAVMNKSEYAVNDTALIDIIEDHKFPFAKAKHEYNWLMSAIRQVKNGGQIIAKIPHKICSQVSHIEGVKVDTAHVYDDCAIVKFVKTKDILNATISYGNSVVRIDSTKVPILTQNNQEYYSYFESVSDQDSFSYISLTAGGKKNCRQQFNDRVDWNPDRVICVSTGADNRKISNGLNFYSFDEIADINRAVDCYYIPENIDFNSFVNILNSQKFLSFLSSVCYNNYQTFNKNFKKKVFNKKIIEFCNEE